MFNMILVIVILLLAGCADIRREQEIIQAEHEARVRRINNGQGDFRVTVPVVSADGDKLEIYVYTEPLHGAFVINVWSEKYPPGECWASATIREGDCGK